jgi:serine/threonine protein kinase
LPESSADENLPIQDDPTREFSDELIEGEGVEFDDYSVDLPKGVDAETAPANITASSDDDSASDSVPDQLGDYAIKKLIGKGGMGRVYLSEHIRMQRTVAVKILPGDRMKDQAAIDRFYAEVRAASRLMHPNIVAAFDAGESEGVHFLVMEYVDGLTLTQFVSRNGPLAVGEAASVIRQAALGLLHAHRAGIVHRDVKPGNLMKANDGTIKILDLGLAQFSAPLWTANLGESGGISEDELQNTLEQEAKSRKGKLIGTLAYMAPEQLESPEEADPRSDIYSLGAVLHFLLLGRPPYTGEYLDQVYGHRHGEIPDLMQLRDDIDLNFANIFRRMLAKTPGQRYASFDEVVDDLSGYTNTSDAPVWLAEFSKRQTGGDASTHHGGSTSGATAEVLAIDLGMFYSSAAVAKPAGTVTPLSAGGMDGEKPIPRMRMAIASQSNEVLFGADAMQIRQSNPGRLVHCLPMYLGKEVVDREVCSERCPPEVLLGMLLKQIVTNAWGKRDAPDAVSITIPASYDQLHRRSILQAAQMAGLKSVRLVDRSVAAVQSMLLNDYGSIEEPDDQNASLSMDDDDQVDASGDELVLFIGLTGQAAEVAVVKRESMKLHQLASAGHWHTGTLAWLHRLVDLAAEKFIAQHSFDPRTSRHPALALQIACEKAMNSMLLLPSVNISINLKSEAHSVSVSREEWIARASDLIEGLQTNITEACERANVSMDQFATCVTAGPLLRIAKIRDALLGDRVANDEDADTKQPIKLVPMERSDIASGAAAGLACELPGRGSVAMPPSCVASQSIGIVVEDSRGRRRILPIIPKGTSLPARTNRRLTVGKERDSMTLSLVESAGVNAADWHSLGRYTFEIEAGHSNRLKRTRMIGFELNVNGMLVCRAQTPGVPGSQKLSDLPAPMLSDDAVKKWTLWIQEQTK